MSLDFYLIDEAGAAIHGCDFNITHNLGAMASEAGFWCRACGDIFLCI
jgi:hypothetical protein